MKALLSKITDGSVPFAVSQSRWHIAGLYTGKNNRRPSLAQLKHELRQYRIGLSNLPEDEDKSFYLDKIEYYDRKIFGRENGFIR